MALKLVSISTAVPSMTKLPVPVTCIVPESYVPFGAAFVEAILPLLALVIVNVPAVTLKAVYSS